MHSVRIIDILCIGLGILITSQIETSNAKYKAINIIELEKASSGQYLVQGNILHNTLYDSPETDTNLTVYNCENCRGFGKFYLSKTGTSYSVSKFVQQQKINGRWPIISRKRSLSGTKFLIVKNGQELWVRLKFSVSSPSFVEQIGGYYFGSI